jgi:hypothetical protein
MKFFLIDILQTDHNVKLDECRCAIKHTNVPIETRQWILLLEEVSMGFYSLIPILLCTSKLCNLVVTNVVFRVEATEGERIWIYGSQDQGYE